MSENKNIYKPRKCLSASVYQEGRAAAVKCFRLNVLWGELTILSSLEQGRFVIPDLLNSRVIITFDFILIVVLHRHSSSGTLSRNHCLVSTFVDLTLSWLIRLTIFMFCTLSPPSSTCSILSNTSSAEPRILNNGKLKILLQQQKLIRDVDLLLTINSCLPLNYDAIVIYRIITQPPQPRSSIVVF